MITNEPLPEREATPDEAFELGKVAGYDEGMAEGLALGWAEGHAAGWTDNANGATRLTVTPSPYGAARGSSSNG